MAGKLEIYNGTGWETIGDIGSVNGTANQIDVANPDSAPVVSLANNTQLPGNPSCTGNESFKLPTGTTAQRPTTPTVGMFRFNTSL